MTAMHFEAKKHAYRQTQDGIVVSFVVHPNDICADLAVAPLGTQYVVALAPYTETTSPSFNGRTPDSDSGDRGSSPRDGSSPLAPEPEKAKKRKPFHTLPRSQQAAIRINDEEFRRWWSGGAADHGRACVDDAVKVECVVSSKAHLNDNPTAAAKWDTIERDYQAWRSLNRPVETEERA